MRTVGQWVSKVDQDTLYLALEVSCSWKLCVLMSRCFVHNLKRLRYKKECPKKNASLRKDPHISIGHNPQVGHGTSQADIRDNSDCLREETEVGCSVWTDSAQ